MRLVTKIATGVVAVAISASACGATDDETVVVLAAASLTDAFGELATAFEVGNPDVRVEISFAGSSALRAQILEGAPADVFASADQDTMRDVIAAGETADAPRIFARNVLAIAVPAGNPEDVTGVGDFARDELLLGLCAAVVPCGALARDMLAAAGVVPALDTEEPDVRALLTKIEVGELDAAIVYETDLVGHIDVVRIPIDTSINVPTSYPIVLLSGGSRSSAARGFVDFVSSDPAQSILESYGFLAP